MDDAEKLKYIFPHGSKSFFKANVPKTEAKLHNTKSERDGKKTLDMVHERQTKGDGRFTVRITSFRVRKVDPDNLAAGCKALVDCIRSGKLIPGDDPTQIRLIVEQERVAHFAQEYTDLEITCPV